MVRPQAQETQRATKRAHISDLEVCLAYDVYRTASDAGPAFTSFYDMFVRLMTEKPGPDLCPAPYKMLAKRFNCDEKLAWSACERANNHGLIEYGTSLAFGWLTDAGKELIRGNSAR